jgi:hypothetical protein
MTHLRYRIARWLVGPFVTLPDKDGVWVVMRWVGDYTAVYQTDRFRLRMCASYPPDEHDDNPTRSLRGRFAGTVKVR